MKIKKHPIPKRYISIFLILAMLFILTAGMVPTIGVAALPSYKNGTMIANQTVYCLAGGSQGGGMTIGSVSSGETVKVYWREGGMYYIEYTVSSGSYSGYKRGYVSASTVAVLGVGELNYTSFSANTTSNQTVYNRSNTSSMTIGTVYSTDSITVLEEDGTWYYIQYPVSGGYKRGYVPKSTVATSTPSAQPTGNFEVVNSSQIGGWAWISTSPNTSINVRIRITNGATGTSYIYLVAANQYRADLYAAGIGNGYHAFSYQINWNNYPNGVYSVEVYGIGGSDPALPNSPRYYTVANSNYFGSGTFFIKNVNSSKYLNVHNSGTTSGTNVNQYTKNFGTNQRWVATPHTGGYYSFRPAHAPNLALGVDNNYTSDSSNISVRTASTDSVPDYCQWKVVSVGNGAYKLVSKCSGTAEKAMMVEASSLADGANVKQYTYYGTHNDEWMFESIEPYSAMNWRYVFDDLDLVKISSGYRAKTADDEGHRAIDIVSKNGPSLISGAEIKCPADGKVAGAGWNDVAGNYVVIETNDIDPSTGNKIRVGFQHLSQISVSETVNTPVSKGTIIGKVGTTGSSSEGYHLHLYMMRDPVIWTDHGRTINPQNFYPHIPFTEKTGGPYVLEIP